MIKVSIMIPTYNQEEYIAQAVESSLAQDYPNLEVIVSDDNSRDETPAIVRKYLHDSRLKYFRNEKNIGKHGNYRKLLYEYSMGDWAINLDGDDYFIDCGFISAAARKIAANPNIVCVQAGFVVKDGNGEYSLCPATEETSGLNLLFKFPKIRVAHSSSMYNRKLACSIDAYRYDIIGEDMETFLRLYLHGDVALLGKAVAVWRKHDKNISGTLRAADHIRNITALTDGVHEYAMSKGMHRPTLEKWKRRSQAMMSNTFCIELFNAGRLQGVDFSATADEFLRYLWTAQRHVFGNPAFLRTLLLYKCMGPNAVGAFYAFNLQIRRNVQSFVRHGTHHVA